MHTALAIETSRVQCGSLVYSVGFRHPAVLAKAVTAIDLLSGGRGSDRPRRRLGRGRVQGVRDRVPEPGPPPRPVRGVRRMRPRVAARRSHLVRQAAGSRSTKPATSRGRSRRSCRSGSAAVVKSARCESRLATPTAGTCRSCHRRHSLASATSFTSTAPRSAVTRRRSSAPSTSAWHGPRRASASSSGRSADFVRPGVLGGSDTEVVDRIGSYVAAGADQVNLALRAPFDLDAVERFARTLGIG